MTEDVERALNKKREAIEPLSPGEQIAYLLQCVGPGQDETLREFLLGDVGAKIGELAKEVSDLQKQYAQAGGREERVKSEDLSVQQRADNFLLSAGKEKNPTFKSLLLGLAWKEIKKVPGGDEKNELQKRYKDELAVLATIPPA